MALEGHSLGRTSGGKFFRTAPPDFLQGQVLANLVAQEGHAPLGIIFRPESYGEGLADYNRNITRVGIGYMLSR
mgnify:CR=1 FL=1